MKSEKNRALNPKSAVRWCFFPCQVVVFICSAVTTHTHTLTHTLSAMSCSHWFCYYCCCCCCRCCSAKQSSKKVVVVAQVEPSEDQRAGVAATSHHSHSVSPSARIKQHQQQQQSNSKPNPRQKETGKEHHKLAAHSSGPHSSAATAPAPAPSLPLERLPRSVSTPIRKYKSHVGRLLTKPIQLMFFLI